MIYSEISALVHYVPQSVLTNDDLSKIVDTSDEWIKPRTGISSRHISSGENTSDICTKIAEQLLKKSGISALDIDMIIVCTMSPDYATPSVACMVQGNIGADNAFAYDLSAACSGFIFGLSTADKFIKSGLYKNIMVIGAEVMSKLMDWSDRSSCVLFGDGGGGAVLKASDKPCGIIGEDLGSKGKDGHCLTANQHQVKNTMVSPENKDKKYLYMDGKLVFNFATRTVPLSISKVLEKTNTALDDVKYIVPHQANSRIIDIIARKLKCPIDKFYVNISEYGNTSAGSIPIALSEMSQKGLLQNGDKIIITGFGGGLTWGSLLIEL